MKKYAVFYITVPNKRLALKIGKVCIQDRLVACSNIIDKVTSIYEWQEEICQENECVLIMKGIYKNFSKIKSKVKELHSYSCPCILALPILDGDKTFLSWLSQSSK